MSDQQYSPQTINNDDDSPTLRQKARLNFDLMRLAFGALGSSISDTLKSISDSIIKPALRGGFNIGDIRYFGTLQSAINSIPSTTNYTLYITNVQTLTANLTVPSNISLVVLKGGQIGGPYTLTINGPFECWQFQCFGTDITVVFGDSSAKTILPTWWGAVESTTVDQSTAFQSCINSIAHAISGGHDPVKIFIPNAKNGYRLESTLTFSGHFAINIEVESSVVTETGASPNSRMVFQWYGGASPVIQLGGTTADTAVFGLELKNLSINGKAGATNATYGIAFGVPGGVTTQQVKFVKTENISITNCRVGASFGRNSAQSSDTACYVNERWYVDSNLDHGIVVDSGNVAAFNFIGSTISNNGYSPTNDAVNRVGYPAGSVIGSNIYLGSGELTLTGNTTAGSGATKPTSADIYQANGSLKINGHWSDTHGYGIYQSSAVQTGYIYGFRHYEGTMSLVNTPTSMRLVSKAVLVGCYCFGDIQSDSGLSGSLTVSGQEFYSGAQRAGVGTYTGTIVTTQRGLIVINSLGNNAQIIGGGGSRAIANASSVVPLITALGVPPLEAIGPAAGDSGWILSQPNPATGTFEICVNCYRNSGSDLLANKIGYGMIFQISPTAQIIDCYNYNFPDTTTPVTAASFTRLMTIGSNVILNQALTVIGLTTLSAVNFSSLTASRLLATDASKNAVSNAALTANGAVYATGSGALASTAALTNGQLLIGSTGLAPVAAAPAGTTNQITVTVGAGTLTFSLPQNIHTGANPTFAGVISTALLDISGAAAGQIKFPATQNASADANTLDDYEEGTWTPVLTRSSTASVLTYGAQAGTYTKIGRQVTVHFNFQITAITTQGTGNNQITGLPFTSGAFQRFCGTVGYNDGFSATSITRCNLETAGTTIQFHLPGPSSNVVAENWAVGFINGSITYEV